MNEFTEIPLLKIRVNDTQRHLGYLVLEKEVTTISPRQCKLPNVRLQDITGLRSARSTDNILITHRPNENIEVLVMPVDTSDSQIRPTVLEQGQELRIAENIFMTWIKPKNYALAFGYNGKDLTGAETDGILLARELAYLGYKTSHITNQAATEEVILSAIEYAAKRSVGPVIVQGSAHGSSKYIWIGGGKVTISDLVECAAVRDGNAIIITDSCYGGRFTKIPENVCLIGTTKDAEELPFISVRSPTKLIDSASVAGEITQIMVNILRYHRRNHPDVNLDTYVLSRQFERRPDLKVMRKHDFGLPYVGGAYFS
ncbi:MAG: hypothetical protein ABIJ34_01965 [archaeon]